jgi:glycosyltransferase involved in cell wall biosynthesis
VEPYLRCCLDSICSQTFTDWECILVDDGSPDGCPAICNEYAAKDPRFIVIHKKQNEGLPRARKSGLDVAKSEFVFHVDGDDWLELNALEVLYKNQQKMEFDIVIGGFKRINPYGIKNCFYPDINYTNMAVWFLLCEYKYLWGKLYRRDLYENCITPETNILEDVILNIQIFLKIPDSARIKIVSENVYNYNRQDNSLLTVTSSRKYNKYTEYPVVQSYLGIAEHLGKLNVFDENIKSAHLYSMLQDGIIPYIIQGNRISKNDIDNIYKAYYSKCLYVCLIKPWRRIIIPIFKWSIKIGKLYIMLLNIISNLHCFLIKYRNS